MFDISVRGIGQDLEFTAFHDGSLTRSDSGKLMKIGSDKTMSLCNNGDDFIGVLGAVGESDGSIIARGFVELPYSGNIQAGAKRLKADGNGGFKEDNGGRQYWIFQVDTTKKTAMVLLG